MSWSKKFIAFIISKKAYSLVLYAFLLSIHFIFKDYLFPISIIFYATPLILIIGYGLFTTLLYHKNKTIRYILLTISCLLILLWFKNYFLFNKNQAELEQHQAILFWNVAKKKELQTNIIINEVKSSSANIISLVETRFLKPLEISELKNKLPKYTFLKLKNEMCIGVKGKIDSVYNRYIEDKYMFNYVIANIESKRTKILIADVSASPFFNKKESLKAILDFSIANEIDIIVGDFNTPYESIHFKDYHKAYNSLHDYGNGFTATWPFGIPLLELDQIWLNKKYKPEQLKKEQYSKSDHKLLIANSKLEKKYFFFKNIFQL